MGKREERTIISLVGRTNVGKSSLLNLLSGQKNFAIVDPTPGTTTDTVIAPMEIHDLGPVKILDTAGVDEFSELGGKKRQKTYEAIEEADLSLVVIDPLRTGDLAIEKELIARARKYNKQALILYNIKEKIPTPKLSKYQSALDLKLGAGLPSLAINATDRKQQNKLADFIRENYVKEAPPVDLLPSVKGNGYVLLIIPMDEETPAMRLLRPQDMAVERLLRNFVTPVLFRLDLSKARSTDSKQVNEEKKRFLAQLSHLDSSPEKLQLVITDSQAFDIVSHWTPEKFPLTSFSIMMTNYMSSGKLGELVEGVKAVDKLKEGDTVLVAEACNHNRKCDDIGTVQIPRLLRKKVGEGLNFEFSFGRPFPEDLKKFSLIIHCGACLIDRQKYMRRLIKANEAGVPFTNYGLLLSYLQGPEVLKRVAKPFLCKKGLA